MLHELICLVAVNNDSKSFLKVWASDSSSCKFCWKSMELEMASGMFISNELEEELVRVEAASVWARDDERVGLIGLLLFLLLFFVDSFGWGFEFSFEFLVGW